MFSGVCVCVCVCVCVWCVCVDDIDLEGGVLLKVILHKHGGGNWIG